MLHKIRVISFPAWYHSQNGTIECYWKTAVLMDFSYLYKSNIPKPFCFCTVQHSVQVMNYLPCKLCDTITSSSEMVNGKRPDFCVLFPLLSDGYYKVYWYGDDANFQAQSQVVISFSHSPDVNGIELYYHITNMITISLNYILNNV